MVHSSAPDVAAALSTLLALAELAERLELPQVAPTQSRYRDRYLEEEEEEDEVEDDDGGLGGCGNPGANFPDLVPREEAARVATSGFSEGAVDSLTALDQRRSGSDCRRLAESLALALLFVATAVILHFFKPAPYFE